MKVCKKENLVLIILAVIVVTVNGISEVTALFPFDESIAPKMDEPKNHSPEDPFGSKLPGEHGLPNEHSELFPDDDLDN